MGASNVFAVLADLDTGEWEEVENKKKRREKLKEVAIDAAAPSRRGGPGDNERPNFHTTKTPLTAQGGARPVESYVSRPRAPVADDYYRAFQKVYRDSQTGDVNMSFHKTVIVKVRVNGEVVLNTDGYFTFTTFLSMNEGLYCLGMKIRYHGEVAAGNWMVVTASGSQTYYDGMVIHAKGPADKDRARTLLCHFRPELVNARQAPEGPVVRKEQLPPQTKAAEPQQLVTVQPQGGTVKASSAGMAPSLRVSQPPLGTVQSIVPPAGPLDTVTAALLMNAPTQRPILGHPLAAPPAQRPVLMPYNPLAQATSYHDVYARRIQSQHLGPPARVGQASAGQTVGPVAMSLEDTRRILAGLGLDDDADDNVDDDTLCVICMDRKKDTVLVPCGHLVLCGGCCEEIMMASQECPMCREAILERLTVK